MADGEPFPFADADGSIPSCGVAQRTGGISRLTARPRRLAMALCGAGQIRRLPAALPCQAPKVPRRYLIGTPPGRAVHPSTPAGKRPPVPGNATKWLMILAKSADRVHRRARRSPGQAALNCHSQLAPADATNRQAVARTGGVDLVSRRPAGRFVGTCRAGGK